MRPGILLAHPGPRLVYIACVKTGNLHSVSIILDLIAETHAAANPQRKRSFAASAEAACFVYARARYVKMPICSTSVLEGSKASFWQRTKKTNMANPNDIDPIMGTIQCLDLISHVHLPDIDSRLGFSGPSKRKHANRDADRPEKHRPQPLFKRRSLTSTLPHSSIPVPDEPHLECQTHCDANEDSHEAQPNHSRVPAVYLAVHVWESFKEEILYAVEQRKIDGQKKDYSRSATIGYGKTHSPIGSYTSKANGLTI